MLLNFVFTSRRGRFGRFGQIPTSKVVLLRSFLSLTYLKAALDALVGSNPEEVGMDLDPDLVYWCNIRLVNSW